MLNIIYGAEQNNIEPIHPGTYFEYEYEPNWMESYPAKELLLDIDKTKFMKDRYVESSVFGGMSIMEISGGSKALLILLNCNDIIMDGGSMGDNCTSWLLEIGKIKDIFITLDHYMIFPDIPFEINIVNTNTIVRNKVEFGREYDAWFRTLETYNDVRIAEGDTTYDHD